MLKPAMSAISITAAPFRPAAPGECSVLTGWRFRCRIARCSVRGGGPGKDKFRPQDTGRPVVP